MDIPHHRRHSLCYSHLLPINLIYLFDYSQVVRRLASLPCYASVRLCNDALVLYNLPICSVRTLVFWHIILCFAFDVWYLRRRTHGMSLHPSQENAC